MWSGVGRLQAATLLSGEAASACRLHPALPARNGLTPAMNNVWSNLVRYVRIAAMLYTPLVSELQAICRLEGQSRARELRCKDHTTLFIVPTGVCAILKWRWSNAHKICGPSKHQFASWHVQHNQNQLSPAHWRLEICGIQHCGSASAHRGNRSLAAGHWAAGHLEQQA